MQNSIVIDIKNLSFSYFKEPILTDVNLTVRHGEFISIVGPNGGGKTTLLKLVLGILKHDKGRILIFGQQPKKARLHIGYMPQHTNLDIKFPITVMEVALMGRIGGSLTGRYKKKDIQIAQDTLAKLNLQNFCNRTFGELSGGQRQRALIARALCCEPEILLLDEPTSNIDPEVEETIFEILKELNKKMTIILVSHDIGVVSQIVQSVICVNRKVVVHPTSRLNGNMIKDIYGGDMRMVRHDHRCEFFKHKIL
ncbi:MAG: ABC transporter ATP-binding protein [Deltaproteobacteria bacterium]|nr:ABC transporter ATP-binding protein [Deltaproteobacteria bacterium]